MTHSEPARTTTRRIPRILVAGLLVVITAIGAALGYQLLASSSSTAASPIDVLRSEHRGALGEADGAVPDGATAFDDEIPGVANLDPALLGARRQAATDAADDGVEFFVDSGWRSPEYQEQLLHEAVSKYGSEEEAARWVATAETSAHVSGDAVDIGHSDADGVAVRARRRVRAVPDLQQRTLALRTAPRSDRSRLPAQICRPHPGPEDPTVTSTLGITHPRPVDLRPPTLPTIPGAHSVMGGHRFSICTGGGRSGVPGCGRENLWAASPDRAGVGAVGRALVLHHPAQHRPDPAAGPSTRSPTVPPGCLAVCSPSGCGTWSSPG